MNRIAITAPTGSDEPSPALAEAAVMSNPRPLEAKSATVSDQTNGAGTAAGIIGLTALLLLFAETVQFFTNPLDGVIGGAIGLLLVPLLGILAIGFGVVGAIRVGARGGAARRMAITGLVSGPIVAVGWGVLVSVMGNYYALVAP
jgi:hypothetical protein